MFNYKFNITGADFLLDNNAIAIKIINTKTEIVAIIMISFVFIFVSIFCIYGDKVGDDVGDKDDVDVGDKVGDKDDVDVGDKVGDRDGDDIGFGGVVIIGGGGFGGVVIIGGGGLCVG